MRSSILILAFFGFLFHANAQTTLSDQEAYIAKYKELAIQEMMRTGVPASITLAQGILESKSGNSSLAKYSNNHFGIKCKSEWAGATVYQDDDIKNECFRVYETAEKSFIDHSDFLKNRPYYTDLFQLDPTDYKSWAKGLKKAGYATERNYAPQLIALIERYHLNDYSNEAMARLNGKKPSDNAAVYAYQNTPANIQPQTTTPVRTRPNTTNQNIVPSQVSTNDAAVAGTNIAPTYPSGIFSINETRVIYAEKGASLFALSLKNNIEYRKLLEYNDLKDKDILDNPTLIFLGKKPKKGSKDWHIVQNGETLYDVAQTEGIQLQSLAILNHIDTSALPEIGERLALKTSSPSTPKTRMRSEWATR